MNYWWVNQNQTFDQEVGGGYMWSPKRKANGNRNPFYEFMREVAPGDLIFSYANTVMPALGVAQSFAYESPKPAEFGRAGPNWSNIGWRVDVYYQRLDRLVKPAEHMDQLAALLPKKYSPLSIHGSGYQGVYLTWLSPRLAVELIELIGEEAQRTRTLVGDEATFEKDVAIGLAEWEEHLSNELVADRSLEDSERSALVLARRGQGKFKDAVLRIESQCRITNVDRVEHLRASHIKPWRDCQAYEERLDGENGFLMTPSIDHLFDRGFISFENRGKLLIAPIAHRKSLRRMGIDMDQPINVGRFSEGQLKYLDYHRDQVFLQAQVNR